MTAVLDASAVLALLYREPGADTVSGLLEDSAISAVNWSEVLQKLGQRGSPAARADGLVALGLDVRPFTRAHAARAAALWSAGRSVALSMADRACLALAAEFDTSAYTADRTWADADVGVTVHVIR